MNINNFPEKEFQKHIEKLIELGNHDVEMCKLVKGDEPLDFAASALETVSFLIHLKEFFSEIEKEWPLYLKFKQETTTPHRT